MIENGEVGFPKYNYWIDLRRIPDQEALIKWIVQLTDKTFITVELIAIFIIVVSRHKGWEIYGLPPQTEG